MNRQIVMAMATGALLLGASGTRAEPRDEMPALAQMHKSEVEHCSAKEVATEHKSEATQLREKAKNYRKLARLYLGRTLPMGAPNYNPVSNHFEKLAECYEKAAVEAERSQSS